MRRSFWRGPAAAVLVIAVLFGGALAGALRTSLAPLPGQAASWDAWGRVLADSQFHSSVAFTMVIAALSTGLSVLLALPLAALARQRQAVQTLMALPMLLPHLLVAVVTVLWLGPGGLADRLVDGLPVLVRDSYGVGIVLVYLVKEVPFLALLVLASWTDDVRHREEVAATLGVGPRARLRTVVWPAVRAPLILGATVVGAFIVGSLQIPSVVGPTSPVMLPTYALEATRVRGLEGQADAAVALLLASLLMLAIASLAMVAVRRLDGVRR